MAVSIFSILIILLGISVILVSIVEVIAILALLILILATRALRGAKVFSKTLIIGLIAFILVLSLIVSTFALVFGVVIVGSYVGFGEFTEDGNNDYYDDNENHTSDTGIDDVEEEHLHQFSTDAFGHTYICDCVHNGTYGEHLVVEATTCQEVSKCEICNEWLRSGPDCRQGYDGNCIWCGQPVNIPDYMSFYLNNQGTGYVLDYARDCGNVSVEVPAYYMGLPVVEIGMNAFYQSELYGITIPNTVTTIGEHAFYNCFYMTSVEFEKDSSLMLINYSAFQCSGLTGVTIPKSVEVVGDNAFGGCVDLDYVEFEEGSSVQYIGRIAFSYCNDLTEFTIPATVSQMGNKVFMGCSSLSNVYFEGSTYEWNRIFFTNDYAEYIYPYEWAETFPLSYVSCADGDYWF